MCLRIRNRSQEKGINLNYEGEKNSFNKVPFRKWEDGIKTQVESTDLQNKTFFRSEEAVVESDRVFSGEERSLDDGIHAIGLYVLRNIKSTKHSRWYRPKQLSYVYLILTTAS